MPKKAFEWLEDGGYADKPHGGNAHGARVAPPKGGGQAMSVTDSGAGTRRYRPRVRKLIRVMSCFSSQRIIGPLWAREYSAGWAG